VDERQKLLYFRWFYAGRPGLYARRCKGDDGRFAYRPVYAELTDELIKAHMRGQVMLGSYPILADNTTHWAAADFDGHNGNAFEHASILVNVLRSYDIEPLCNVSQSGKGVHVRIIFADHRSSKPENQCAGAALRPVHAAIAHRFMAKVVAQTELPNIHQGGAFDRVFPSQDRLVSSKSIGNQIAMPFNMEAAEKRGGSMLLDRDFNRIQLSDSWEAMQNYRLIRIVDLLDAAMAMGEVHHIFECVDADNNFIESSRFDRASHGSVYHRNKKERRTRSELEFMVRACDFIQWAKHNPQLSYHLWLALASQLIVYDAVGGRSVFHAISSLDSRIDNRGQPVYSSERTDRQYDHALSGLRGPYSCRRIATEGWACRWMGEQGCTKFTLRDGRGAHAPARLPFFRMDHDETARQGCDG